MDSNQSTLFKIWETGSRVSVGLVHPESQRAIKANDLVRSDVKDALRMIEGVWKLLEDGIIANIDREVGGDLSSERRGDSGSSQSRKRTGDSVSSDSDPRKRRRATESPFSSASTATTLSFQDILDQQGMTERPFKFSFGVPSSRKRVRDDEELPNGGDLNPTFKDLGVTDRADQQRMKRVKVKKETED